MRHTYNNFSKIYISKSGEKILGEPRCSEAILTNRNEKLRHEVIVSTSAQNRAEIPFRKPKAVVYVGGKT